MKNPQISSPLGQESAERVSSEPNSSEDSSTPIRKNQPTNRSVSADMAQNRMLYDVEKSTEQTFSEKVVLRYQLYKGLMSELPFENLSERSMMLLLLGETIARDRGKGFSAKVTLENFFKRYQSDFNRSEQLDALFKSIQFIERQVTLFDALEEASFEDLVDIHGEGTLKHFLGRAQSMGKMQELETLLHEYKVRIVLTAHPTQFYSAAILMIIYELYQAIKKDDLLAVHDLLKQLGRTPFKNKQRPTPEDEASSIMIYLRKVFYHVIPAIEELLEQRMRRSLHKEFTLPSVLEMGFWPGGDRDGNPNVTAATTLNVARMLKQSIIRCYCKDFKYIRRKLTFKGIEKDVRHVEQRLEHTLRLVGAEFAAINQSHEGGAVIPPRADQSFLLGANEVSQPEASRLQPYKSPEELSRELLSIEEKIISEHKGYFASQVALLIRKVQAFGFHFATIDIRENRTIHHRCVCEVLEHLDEGDQDGGSRKHASTHASKHASTHASYSEQSEEAQLATLERLMEKYSSRMLAKKLSEKRSRHQDVFSKELIEMIKSLGSVAHVQRINGEMGLNRYIVSHTESALHIAELYFLFYACTMVTGGGAGVGASADIDVRDKDKDESMMLNVDIIPLFEDIQSLKAADQIMADVYKLPFYRDHLRRRGHRQTVMVGYSDGTKDGGYLASNWCIFRAKENISEVSTREGVEVVFFDGRGGPPARGGGESNLFYRALSEEVQIHALQLTVQGQTISSNFTTFTRARYNLEQFFTAGLANRLFQDKEIRLSAKHRKLLLDMAETSLSTYVAFRKHPGFVPYLETITPLRFFGLSNVGSRPTRRSSKGALTLNDLRAIPFVASWNQLKQNVPAYYGFGSALASVMDREGGREVLKTLYAESLFFRTLIGNAMQALLKTDFSLTEYLREDDEFGEVWRIAYDEAMLTKRLILDISGQEELLEELPLNRLSIQFREGIVRPLVMIQQYALILLRENEETLSDEHREKLRNIVIRSLAGSINASRNSA